MASIQALKIYAQIKIGRELTITSPDSTTDGIILSFQVSKNRTTPSTFSASLKVLHEKMTRSPIGAVEIRAGVNSPEDLIFTGTIRSAKIRPCFDDPAYVLMDIQGVDILGTLQGKTFTSRSRATRSAWCAITGVQRKGLKSGKFKPTPQESFTMDSGTPANADKTETSPVQVGNNGATPAPHNSKSKEIALTTAGIDLGEPTA